MNDFKFALRQFQKSPGFAATVILTISLGIGANTAIFTLVHAVLMKSLPVTNPHPFFSQFKVEVTDEDAERLGPDLTAEVDAFTQWCDSVHHAEALEVDGFVSGRRFELVPGYRYAATAGARSADATRCARGCRA